MTGDPKQPCVYILAGERNGTPCVAVTGDLARRVWLHKTGETGGFTSRYTMNRLVCAETHETMEAAIFRGKQIKKWRRACKRQLIEKMHPQWRDLYGQLLS
jgi:putative endonuclease